VVHLASTQCLRRLLPLSLRPKSEQLPPTRTPTSRPPSPPTTKRVPNQSTALQPLLCRPEFIVLFHTLTCLNSPAILERRANLCRCNRRCLGTLEDRSGSREVATDLPPACLNRLSSSLHREGHFHLPAGQYHSSLVPRPLVCL
jgi:hypothetical protein